MKCGQRRCAFLYVALTRAKEKTDHDRGFCRIVSLCAPAKDGVITAGAKSYFDWIIPALWSEEEEAALEDAPVCIFFSIQEMT